MAHAISTLSLSNRKQKTENRKQKTENRKQKTENRKQKTENRKQKTEPKCADLPDLPVGQRNDIQYH
ncbi:DUF874 family protein [Aeromonas caviae]